MTPAPPKGNKAIEPRAHTVPDNRPAVTAIPSKNPDHWVDQYGDYLYRYAFSRTQDRPASEDLVQETLLAALKARENFEGRSSVRTWLTSILRHKIVDHFRKKQTEKTTDAPEMIMQLNEEAFDNRGRWQIGPKKWNINPTDLLDRKEFWSVLYQCISDLPPRTARAFVLRELDGLNTEDICKVLDITKTNCWVMLHRARNHLRHCLESRWFSEPKKEGHS